MPGRRISSVVPGIAVALISLGTAAWTPDLRRNESRLTLAFLIKL